MNTPTTIREHHAGGTPPNCKRKTVSPVEDAAVRNVRPKWDRKKNALCHLREDEQEEERLRPITKASSTAATAHLHIQMNQPRGSERALLDSILAKTTLLRKDQLKLGVLGTLSSDKAKYIPLVFENLMKLSDHAEQSTAGRQTLGPPDLEQYNELSAKVAEQQEQLDAMLEELRNAHTHRRRYHNERNNLREQLQRERKQKEIATREKTTLQKKLEELVESRDHHRDLANRTRKDLGVLRAENDYLTASLESIKEQRDTSRRERDKYQRQLEEKNVEDVESQTLADLGLRLSQYSSTDHENEELIEEPPALNHHRDRRGNTRQLDHIDASREVTRKRKSAEMASDEGEEDTSGSNISSVGQNAAVVRARNPAGSSLGPQPLTYATVSGAAGPSRPTITRTSLGIFTMSVADAKAQDCTSDVIPVVALDALKTQIRDWIGRPADRGDWFRKVNGSNRVCLMMRVRKKKCLWEDGEDFACKTCQDAGDFCVVAKKDGTIQLLPRKDSGNQGLRPSDENYWIS